MMLNFIHKYFNKKHRITNKHLEKKISEELMPIAWHPKRRWNSCMSEDDKKEIEPSFTG